MPTYLYCCDTHGEFEEYHSMSIVLEDCPKCIEDGKSGEDVKKLKRLICGTNRGVVELYGNDLVAKTKEDIQKMKREMHGSEKLYSNFLGEDKYQAVQQRIDKQKREKY